MQLDFWVTCRWYGIGVGGPRYGQSYFRCNSWSSFKSIALADDGFLIKIGSVLKARRGHTGASGCMTLHIPVEPITWSWWLLQCSRDRQMSRKSVHRLLKWGSLGILLQYFKTDFPACKYNKYRLSWNDQYRLTTSENYIFGMLANMSFACSFLPETRRTCLLSRNVTVLLILDRFSAELLSEDIELWSAAENQQEAPTFTLETWDLAAWEQVPIHRNGALFTSYTYSFTIQNR